jgi:hypothetical protein
MHGGEQKLKLSSRKLMSGRFQISFRTEGEHRFYGYLLAEPKTPVREIVQKIERHLEAFVHPERYLQPNLFSLGKRTINSGRIMIFKRDMAHGENQR